MGFWPFGGGKRQRMVESDDHARDTLLPRNTSDSMAQEKRSNDVPALRRATSRNKREEKPRRLSKVRTQGSKDALYSQPSRSQTAPIRTSEDPRLTSRTNTQYNEKGLYQHNRLSHSSLGPDDFTVVQAPPTLYGKRTEPDHHLPRRKSSKRKAEDYAREREIRAMSTPPIPIPKRPATFYGSNPLQRDSRQIPGPLNRRLERPTSEISLPLPGTLSDIDDMSRQNSFKVGIFAALSPRPTVRYDANPRKVNAKQPVRPNMAIRQAIAEEDVSDKKRIDELADDLDAGGLRELMERDRRRRERKKDIEKAKLQRRLQRRADRQREEELRRARTEAFVQGSPAGPSRSQGAGTQAAQEQTSSPLRESPIDTPEANPFEDPDRPETSGHEAIRNPFDDEKDMDIMQDPQDSEDEPERAVPVPVRSPLRRVEPDDIKPKEEQSHSTLSPPVSPVHRAAVDRSSMSQASILNRETTPDIPESASLERRISEQSGQRLSSWTAIFRRNSRRKFAGPSQGRSTPSEFSNTSRESFQRKQPPAVAPRTFRRSDSAIPQRTLSRFREDLPELPISPPDSRIQSPEASAALEKSAASPESGPQAKASAVDGAAARESSEIPDPELGGEVGQDSPTDLDIPTSRVMGMALSRSLASVDSEASWLSGKPHKRQSGHGSHSVKPSQSSVPSQMPGAPEQDDEDELMDDDFYSRLSPASQEGRPSIERKASSAIIDLQQEQRQQRTQTSEPSPSPAVEEKRHDGVARQPTVVYQADRVKSREGLLDEFAVAESRDASSPEDEDVPDVETPGVEVDDASVLRAKSVDYKKGHARHVSAGSAKLLDIRRSSTHSDTFNAKAAGVAGRKSDLALHLEDSGSKAMNS